MTNELTRRKLIGSGAAIAAGVATAPLLQTMTAAAKAFPPRLPRRRQEDMIDDVIDVMTKRSFATKADILSTDRSRRSVHARQRGMFICREIGCASLSEIGRRFGGRDPSAVLLAERKVRHLMASDSFYRVGLETLIFYCLAQIELKGHAPDESRAPHYYAWRSRIEGYSLERFQEKLALC